MRVTTVGIDLAKNVLQIHGAIQLTGGWFQWRVSVG